MTIDEMLALVSARYPHAARIDLIIPDEECEVGEHPFTGTYCLVTDLAGMETAVKVQGVE